MSDMTNNAMFTPTCQASAMKGISPPFEDLNRANEEEDHEEWLNLSLGSGFKPKPPNSPSRSVPIQPMPPLISNQEPYQDTYFSVPPHHPPPPPSELLDMPLHLPQRLIPAQPDQDQAGPFRPARARRLPVQVRRAIIPPYPWATSERATVYSLEYLLSKGMNVISGAVVCKRCEKQFEIEYDLREKFVEVAEFIAQNKCSMHHRAPSVWMNPVLPDCKFCGQENCVKPVLTKKKSINWLFLLLGQMLGCCKLSHLKYFCKHTGNHRTGAKDRVLFLTYLGLCKQLDPKGPFKV